MHFVGQSTILSLTVDQGTGQAYCLAHHLTVDGGKRRLMLRHRTEREVISPSTGVATQIQIVRPENSGVHDLGSVGPEVNVGIMRCTGAAMNKQAVVAAGLEGESRRARSQS